MSCSRGCNDPFMVVSELLLGAYSASLSCPYQKVYRWSGMYCNLFAHSIIGLFHFKSSLLRNKICPEYRIAQTTSQLFPVAFLLADLYRDKTSRIIFTTSGLAPFLVYIMGGPIDDLKTILTCIHILCLCKFTTVDHSIWGAITGAVTAFTYFACPEKLYPLSLILLQFSAGRLVEDITGGLVCDCCDGDDCEERL